MATTREEGGGGGGGGIQFSSVCAGSQMLLPSLPGLSLALHRLAG